MAAGGGIKADEIGDASEATLDLFFPFVVEQHPPHVFF